MNYEIENVYFKLNNFTHSSKNILGLILIIYFGNKIEEYKLINYLGKGTIGQVYLIESIINKKIYVIKISNFGYTDSLINEVKITKNHFSKEKIIHSSYPIYSGKFTNINSFGVIYPFLGYYNLDKLKKIDYKISFNNNVKIVKQLINQLINFKNIIHCDLKPANVVINVTSDITVTIIDFGLIKDSNDKEDIISTSFITSPESLLSLEDFKSCLDSNITFEKHDYFGLFSIIVNLFVKTSYWEIIFNYLINHLKYDNQTIQKRKSIIIFVYIWYKFNYDTKEQIINQSLKKLIKKIENYYPYI
jgi:serine/threonine protein kinase